MGMEGGEEGAEVEMRTEVVECRLRGAEPLIDCSGLTVALFDCHFKHTPTVYLYSCEGLLLLSLTLTLILAETLYKFLILEVQMKNSVEFHINLAHSNGWMFSPAMENLQQEKENKLHIILIAFIILLETYEKKNI